MGDAITTVRQLIDHAADHQPQKGVFIDPESGLEINYGQLRQRCLEREGRFQGHGLRLGDFIAVLGENGLPLVEHLLASMYAGLIPVPLNLLEASARLSTILKHCKAKAIYASDTQLGHARVAADGCEHRVRLELLEPIGDGSIPHSISGAPGGQVPIDSDAGLLIYTSGTTDRPKGALFTHANLLACAANTARSQALSEHDRLLNVLSLYHMNAVDRLLNTIWTEGSAVLAPRFQLDRYWDWVVEYRCTWLSLVPTKIAQLLSREGPDRESLAMVRYARSSSAPLSAAHRELFEAKFGIPIREGMGMTEGGTLFMNPPPPGIAKPGAVGIAAGSR